MRFFGIPVAELASVLAIITVLVGFVSWGFRVIVIDPLRVSMKDLSGTIDSLRNELKDLQKENKSIYDKIDDLELEVRERGMRYEQQIKSIFARVKFIEDKFIGRGDDR